MVKASAPTRVQSIGNSTRLFGIELNAHSPHLRRVSHLCIRDDAFAAKALKIFAEQSVDDLIVVNAKCVPVGLVDSQDLPKLKLM